MKKIILNPIFFTLLFINCVFGQTEYGFLKGQIVKKENDTIDCFVQMSPSYGSSIKYKMMANSPELKLDVIQIKLLITPYNKFENVKYNDRERLMTILQSGNATLYSYMYFDEPRIIHQDATSTITNSDQVATYVLKKENTLNEVKRGNFKELLNLQLSDCGSVIAKINSKKYKFKDLEKVIEEYNSCN